MGGVIGVNHIGVSVRDLGAAAAFWSAVGFTGHLEFAWPAGTRPADEALGLVDSAAQVAVLRSATSYLELFEFSAPAPAARPEGAPGVCAVEVAVADVSGAVAVLESLGHTVADDGGTRQVRCPDGTPVTLREGPVAGLTAVRLRVADPRRSPLARLVPSGAVALRLEPGASRPPSAPCDLGANHVCLDVDAIADVRSGLGDGVAWHHEVTASSGGKASVCYGTTRDGVVVELLESHIPDAALARARLEAV